jgi:hypothetical protein
MSVAQMIGGPDQSERSIGRHIEDVFGCSDHYDTLAVLRFKDITVTERRSPRQQQLRFLAILEAHQLPGFLALVEGQDQSGSDFQH